MTLAETIAEVERELALLREDCAIGEAFSEDWRAWRTRREAAVEQLIPRLVTTVGAVITERWDGASVRIAGVRSTRTGGVVDALNNWVVAARKRERTE